MELITPFSFAPSIQEASGLENTSRASSKQWEAENGGLQLLYHGRGLDGHLGLTIFGHMTLHGQDPAA
jgi:hypothetical protein